MIFRPLCPVLHYSFDTTAPGNRVLLEDVTVLRDGIGPEFKMGGKYVKVQN